MQELLLGIRLLAVLVAVVCHVIVVVKMFQHGETVRGIIYGVLLFACGAGALLALLYGIRKQHEWQIQTVVRIFGFAILLNIKPKLLIIFSILYF